MGGGSPFNIVSDSPAQSLGKNIKNIIYSINIYIFLILFPFLHNFNVKFYSKNQVFGHKKSEKSTRIFLNTDFGKEKNPLESPKFSKVIIFIVTNQ